VTADWSGWIGRSRTQSDRVDPALVQRWCATLDRALPDGDETPQGLHWCLALPDAPTASLGEDGHPRREHDPDGLMPPIALPRRMWAAGTLQFHATMQPGTTVTRQSRVTAINEKTGSSGPLAFVDVAHDWSAGDRLLISETQTIVYRAAAPANAPPSPPPPGPGMFDAAAWTRVRSLVPGAALLMRYSALTFNAHRIHYDWRYATGAEGYRGLVVHGPLIASLLLDLARQQVGDNALTGFAFRAVSAAIADEALHLALRQAGEGLVLQATADDGRVLMTATATL
jgi:3-methylfumaryl-CoA hydratase